MFAAVHYGNESPGNSHDKSAVALTKFHQLSSVKWSRRALCLHQFSHGFIPFGSRVAAKQRHQPTVRTTEPYQWDFKVTRVKRGRRRLERGAPSYLLISSSRSHIRWIKLRRFTAPLHLEPASASSARPQLRRRPRVTAAPNRRPGPATESTSCHLGFPLASVARTRTRAAAAAAASGASLPPCYKTLRTPRCAIPASLAKTPEAPGASDAGICSLLASLLTSDKYP